MSQLNLSIILKVILDEFPVFEVFSSILNPTFKNELSDNFYNFIIKIYENIYTCDLKELENSLLQLDKIQKISWEQLNNGVYKDVPKSWRNVYAINNLFIVFTSVKLCKNVTFEKSLEFLRLIDMALIMGGELTKNNIAANLGRILHIELVKINKPFYEEINCKEIHNYKSDVLSSNVKNICRISIPSFEQFLQIMQSEKPIIITDYMNSWPALSSRKWSIKKIKEICGYRLVPVEIGETYASENWTQKLMTINEFIDEYFYESNDQKGYLAQHYLFDQITELYDDIEIPEYCYCDTEGNSTEIDINGWFGPSDTISPLHQDPKINLLCQIFGKKYVKLYPVSQTDYLYPNSVNLLKNTSQVDVINPDLDKFPLFKYAKGYEAVLEEGEMLLIPPKCWHYVRSLTYSFSVNFWWCKHSK